MPGINQQGSIIILISMVALVTALGSALALQMLSQLTREHNLSSINAQSRQLSRQYSSSVRTQLLDTNRPDLIAQNIQAQQDISGVTHSTKSNFARTHDSHYSLPGYSLNKNIGAVHYRLETSTSTANSQTPELITGFVCNGVLTDQVLDNQNLQSYALDLNYDQLLDVTYRFDSVTGQIFRKLNNQSEKLIAQLDLSLNQQFSRTEFFIHKSAGTETLVISFAIYTPEEQQADNKYYLLFDDTDPTQSVNHIIIENDLVELQDAIQIDSSHWGYFLKLDSDQLIISATLAYANRVSFITQMPFINLVTGNLNYKNKIHHIDLNPNVAQRTLTQNLDNSTQLLLLSMTAFATSGLSYLGSSNQTNLLYLDPLCKRTYQYE